LKSVLHDTHFSLTPMILITGGAGFIGGNFVHHWFERRL